MEDKRGFTKQGVLQKCLMLGEEVGELFKAIRKKRIGNKYLTRRGFKSETHMR